MMLDMVGVCKWLMCALSDMLWKMLKGKGSRRLGLSKILIPYRWPEEIQEV